ncbi:MAG: hypothetical protein EZS28_054858, partial [Streblomastix strix]
FHIVFVVILGFIFSKEEFLVVVHPVSASRPTSICAVQRRNKRKAALIRRLNFLRTQFREASLYLMLIDSAKASAVKTQSRTGKMVSPLGALKQLY